MIKPIALAALAALCATPLMATTVNFAQPGMFLDNGTVVATVGNTDIAASAFIIENGEFVEQPGTLVQFPAGIGIDTDELAGFTDFEEIDGSGQTDALVLEFFVAGTNIPQALTITALTLTNIDSNDGFALFGSTDGGVGDFAAVLPRTVVDPTVPVGTETTAEVPLDPQLTLSSIGLAALETADNFTLNALEFEVSAVPLPISGWLLLGGLGALVMCGWRSCPRASLE